MVIRSFGPLGVHEGDCDVGVWSADALWKRDWDLDLGFRYTACGFRSKVEPLQSEEVVTTQRVQSTDIVECSVSTLGIIMMNWGSMPRTVCVGPFGLVEVSLGYSDMADKCRLLWPPSALVL